MPFFSRQSDKCYDLQRLLAGAGQETPATITAAPRSLAAACAVVIGDVNPHAEGVVHDIVVSVVIPQTVVCDSGQVEALVACKGWRLELSMSRSITPVSYRPTPPLAERPETYVEAPTG